MKIRLLRCVAIKGQPTQPGAIVDVANADAASLIRRKMAEQAEEGPAPQEPVFLDATAPEPEQPKRKGRAK